MKKAFSNTALLDVNVLLALAWPNHQFHDAATRRFRSKEERWATCALTQLGFIRLSCNAAVVSSARTPGEAASLLSAMISDRAHVYLSQTPSPLGICKFGTILGSAQVTDVYLIMLAAAHRASFITFDNRLRS